jgi:hypothetical protein
MGSAVHIVLPLYCTDMKFVDAVQRYSYEVLVRIFELNAHKEIMFTDAGNSPVELPPPQHEPDVG